MQKGHGEKMATSSEIRIWQKTTLFKLLKLKKDIGESQALNNLIIAEKAAMEAEDVAYVEKLAAETE
ncbi:MAG: hypothetical protein LBC86_08230 [Oscillospiraceae bacterium]|nr:hypothetical protein [Oscillospiraceae bacterium]